MRKGNSDRKLHRHHVNIGSTCRKLRRKAAASSSLSSISFDRLSLASSPSNAPLSRSLSPFLSPACLFCLSAMDDLERQLQDHISVANEQLLVARQAYMPADRQQLAATEAERNVVQASKIVRPSRRSSPSSGLVADKLATTTAADTHTVPTTRAPAAQEPWPRADLPPGAQASRRRHQCRTHRAPPPPTRDRHALSSLTLPLSSARSSAR